MSAGEGFRISRRALLLAGVAPAWGATEGKGATFPSEVRWYADPATEFQVYRLTDPKNSSVLPGFYNRSITKRGTFLIYASDRSGSRQAFRLDLKSGDSRQLTDAKDLDAETLSLTATDSGFSYFDGAVLRQSTFTGLREHEVYRIPEGWKRCEGAHFSEDGTLAAVGEMKSSETSRLRLIAMARGGGRTVVEAPFAISHPVMNPRRAQILYRQGDEVLWVVNHDGKQNRKLKLAEGKVGPARWSPDGRTVLYLNYPEDPKQLNTLREYSPDAGTDKLIAKTSQFVHFGVNSDSSVFVGASRNNASPTLLLLLRVTRRELTICEHKATDPATVAPVFSPNSQMVFFQSDRHGKPAIYRVKVDKFVEETEQG